ncbi:hypothetical protein PG996_010271 [Apiospora saccharicola]|uniref:Uncharacterized protein n=1 Tax=Apiospora saccharicola TaxID=335842 RepID=A0ABR1UN55_9PEZI
MGRSGNVGSPQNNNSTRKKASSFAGLLGKLLPTHRPEQGGTLRSMDDRSNESAYHRLGMNPEELKEWNIAEDLPIRRRLELAEERTNSSRRPEPPRPSTSPTARRPPIPFKQTDRHLSAAETQHLLKRKQRSQRKYRELKASGDWLGVTGANPQTGQYNVLTPTDSASSDLTPPSTKTKMRKLTKRVQQAERDYENAKAMEDAAREGHMQKKAQMKLDKIELAKVEIQQQQHGPLEWKRRDREWSSVREPGLSPIAQSFTNTESEIPGEGVPLSAPQHQERGNKLQKRRRNAETSADTIIHTPSRQISASAPPQGQEDSDTRADAQVPNPLLGCEGGMKDGNPSLPPPNQNDTYSLKDQTLRDQSTVVATAISSPSTSREPTTNHFAKPRRLDRSQSAVDLTNSMRKPQYPPALHPGEDGIARYETSSQVNVRDVTAQSSSEHLVRPRSADNHTEKGLADPSKERSQVGPHLSRQTKKGVEVEPDTKTNILEVHPSVGIIREAEGKHIPEWPNEIIETIERRNGTGQSKDSVFTPITTTTGYAHALLIQPISGAMLGQMDGLVTDSAGALATRSSIIEPPRPFCTLASRPAGSTTTSHHTTMQSGSPKHEYSRSVPIFGTASAKIVEIRRPKSSAGTESLLARGYLRSRKGESMSTQRAISAPKSQLAVAQSNEKHREATVQGAARTAIMQSREKVLKPQAAPPKEAPETENKDESPDEKEKDMQEGEGDGEEKSKEEEKITEQEEKEEEGTAKPEGEGEDTAGHSPPEPRKYDAINTLQKIALAIASWVWATIKYWWAVMGPVFDGESELWKRRYQEESTWNDVGIFLFAGVSVIVGLASGVHVFKAVGCLL